MKPFDLSRFVVLLALLGGCIQTDKERVISDGAKPLTKADALKALKGNTMTGSIPQYNLQFAVFYTPEGAIVGKLDGALTDNARGRWEIKDDGQICNTWDKQAWNNGPPCNTFYNVAGEYQVFNETGALVSRAKVEPGNLYKMDLRTDLEIAQAKGDLKPVSAEELRKKLEGRTLSGQLPGLNSANYHALYATDGRISASIPGSLESDQGKWRIDETGAMCVKWTRWEEGKERCAHYYERNGELRAYDEGGTLALRGKVREGNPEKLKI